MNSKYYIHKNLAEYQEYYDLNANKTVDEIIKIVNVHRNREYYDNTIATDMEKGYGIIVNKYCESKLNRIVA